jgi:hypothetical protein
MSQCMHLVGDRRCTRRARWAFAITYQWNINGTGIVGPNVRMCRQHGDKVLGMPKDKRFPVVDGWFGRVWNAEAKVYTIHYCVFATKDGHTGSKAWAKYQRPYDRNVQDMDYDEARRAA